MRAYLVCLALAATAALSEPAHATPVDALNFTETTLATIPAGMNTGLAWAPDGSRRLFVPQKTGAVRIVKDGMLLATPFSTDVVFTNSECGLIGIAFDPNFVQNGFVYLFETVSPSEQQIVRYTASGDVGVGRTLVVAGLPTAGNNHDGGAIGFGPDGKLYWAIGDLGNGTGVNANLTSLAAKVARANRDGSLPSGNPFADGAGPNNDYIWARGFRNPFALAFQPGIGALWVDVAGTSYEQIFVVTAGSHAGYNLFENTQPAEYLAPAVVYRTNGTDARSILAGNGAVRSGGIVTFTTNTAHGFRKGGRITLAGVVDSSFNISSYVLSVPTTTTFTFAQAGPNATSGSGAATTLDVGGAVTGGDFWSSSAVPTAYRGNYFFGDFNSGRVERVTLGPDNSVTSVDHFASAEQNAVDVALGPDGALYVAQHSGAIKRVSYNATSQAVVATPLHLRIDESGRGVVSVRLAQAPAANVTVSASISTGDSDISIASGSSLVFTPGNWSLPQVVLLQSTQDSDATEDQATLSLASAGLTSEAIGIAVTDSGGTTAAAAAVPAAGLRHIALFGVFVLAAGVLLLRPAPGTVWGKASRRCSS